MNKRHRPTLGVITALAVAVVAALAGQPHAQGPDGQLKAIGDLLDRQVADWNKGDLDGFLKGYWNSPDLMFQSGGDRLQGFEPTRDRYRKRYQAEGRAMGRLAFSDLKIDILGAGYEAAMARGRWELTMPDGKKVGGLFTLILRDFPRGEGWKIVHDHTSIGVDPAVPPAPPEPPVPTPTRPKLPG